MMGEHNTSADRAVTACSPKWSSRAIKVLEVIQQEAQHHGAFQQGSCLVTLVRRETGLLTFQTPHMPKCEYRFAAAAGGTAVGTISEQAWEDVLTFATDLMPQGVASPVPAVTVRHASTCHISLAIRETSRSVQMESQRSVSEQTISKLYSSRAQTKRILMVEDNTTFAEVVRRFLSRHEIEVVHELNGERAWARIEQDGDSYGLVVSDMHMPRLNGLGLLNRMRAEPRTRDVPIMLLTSDSDVELELQALSAGADLVLLKSVDPRLLGLHIKRLLGMTRAEGGA